MATIDPNIALGYRPIQIENPVNQFAKMQELQLGQAKMQEYQRGLEEQNALRQLVKEGLDPNTPEFAKRAYQVSPELGIKVAKSQAELNKARYEADKLKGDVIDSRLKQSRGMLENVTTPEEYLAWHEANHRDDVLGPLLASRGITADQSRARIINALQQPGGLQKLIMESKLGAEKFQSDLTTRRGQDLTAQVAREGHNLQYDPELQGRIAEARKKGEARAEDMSQQMKDVQANRKALASAGYDVTTGKDEITDLIKKSTGSGVGKGVDILGAAVGKSTKGSEALAALETRANAITSGLLNGKLGAGISNADRDFIVAQIGNLANGTTPTATRLAAWNAAKERMIKLGMVEAPSTPNSNINVPGVGSTIKTPGSSAAAPAGKPTLDSIFGTGKKD